MRYASFKSGPWPKAGLATKTLLRVFPRSNPDFGSVYEDVVFWWLEVNEKNVVLREIGFNGSGAPVAAAPLGDNYGIFTDINSAPDGLGPDVEPSTFDQTWQQFERNWLASKRPRVV
jgi:hypothetical protein